MENQKFTTCKVPVMYPWVNQPDTKFDPDGLYRVEAVFDPKDEEHKAWLGQLAKFFEEAKAELKKTGKQANNKPWKKQVDPETKEETGKIVVAFKSKFRPKAFDAKGHSFPEDTNIGNDSVCRISFEKRPYEGMGGGLKLYFKAIQVISLVPWEGGSADDYGFDEEEGYESNVDPLIGEDDKENITRNSIDEGMPDYQPTEDEENLDF